MLLHVDDLFLTGDEVLIVQCKRKLVFEYEMKDLGLMHYYLGLEIWQQLDGIFVGQGKYIVTMLKRFGMMNCKSMDTLMVTNLKKIRDNGFDLINPTMYHKLIGVLNYLVNTRPDICYAVNALSQFLVEPCCVHWVAAKHIFRYLRGTIEYGLMYASNREWKLYGFSNADWASRSNDRKSTSGYCFRLLAWALLWFLGLAENKPLLL